MEKKVAILKIDKNNNKKEVIYISYDSIFDIKRKNSYIYALKKLIELEKLVKGDDSITYEFKLIEDDDLEVYLSNCLINDRQCAPQGSFNSFLVYYARTIDEFINEEPSKININNYNLNAIIEWTKQRLKEQRDVQVDRKHTKKG